MVFIIFLGVSIHETHQYDILTKVDFKEQLRFELIWRWYALHVHVHVIFNNPWELHIIIIIYLNDSAEELYID